MIYKIFGNIVSLSYDALYIEQGYKDPASNTFIPNGLTWEVHISHSSYRWYEPKTGESIHIYTWMHSTEHNIALYGFHSLAERSIFLTLLTVNRIGPKAALKILSNTTANDLIQYIQNQDIKALSKLPGVGNKKASTILLTLEGVYLSLGNNTSTSTPQEKKNDITIKTEHTNYKDIIIGLIQMGYIKDNITKALDLIIEDNTHETLDEGAILKQAIVYLEQR